jgi:hypothetical protein
LIKKGLDRSETNQTGVYVLLGQTKDGPLAYVGEAEDMRTRLRQHVSGKEWWDTAILITTTGDMLHKAHVKYLESRLVEIARSVGNTPLENASTPPRSSLNEAAMANMESFLDTLKIVLPAIRVDMFLEKARPVKPAALTVSKVENYPTFDLNTPKHGIIAKAILIDGEILVQAGSLARKEWAGGRDEKTHYFKLFEELVLSGVLQIQGNKHVFQQNYAFSSPSAAASVVNGRSSNGRREWKHTSSKTSFAEWEKQQVIDESIDQ